MNKKRLILTVIAMMAITALLFASCAPAAEPTTAPEEQAPAEEQPAPEESMAGGTLTVGVSYDTPNFDNLTTGTTPVAMLLVFDTLVTRGPDGEYYGLVAKSWDVSDDNLEWTFHLRDDITYHDGTALTAETVKWFYDKARDPEGQHAFSDSYAAVDEILAPDDTTLVFKLNNPWPNMLFTVSNSFSGLISPAAYEKYGEEYGTKYAVGSGPFMLESWIPEDTMVVVRNPNYQWGAEFLENQGPPYLDKIVFKLFPEATTRISELLTGGIDMLYEVPTADLDQITNSGDYQIFTAPAWGGALFYLDLNETKPPLDNVLVRQAINWAVDVDVLAKLNLGDYGTPAYGYMAPHWNCGMEDPKSISYGYDPQKAKDLLAEAGWTDSNGNGTVDKDGEELQFTLWIYNDSEAQSYGEVLQSQLGEAGIGIDLLQLEYGSMVDGFNANENTITLLNYGWPDSDVYNLFFYTDQIPYLNSSHIDDPVMNDLLDKANTAPTSEERCQYFAEVEQYAIEQAVWAPIFWLTSVTAVNNKVQGILISPYTENYNSITLAK
jgi:peptide/nickel transport system substrate-binding protein